MINLTLIHKDITAECATFHHHSHYDFRTVTFKRLVDLFVLFVLFPTNRNMNLNIRLYLGHIEGRVLGPHGTNLFE